MTPGTMEEEIFETIQNEKKNLPSLYDLRLESPLFDLSHPKILKAKLEFERDQNRIPDVFLHPDYSAAFYGNVPEALANHKAISKVLRGSPSEMSQFMLGNEDAVVDFSDLGVAVISKNKIIQGPSKGIHLHVLPLWVTYALSPELWGAVGKWTRFHERLHVLFEKYNLLDGKDIPGYYPLKSQGQWLEKHGFRGTLKNNQYVLSMNWTFPLTALVKLEDLIAKEQ